MTTVSRHLKWRARTIATNKVTQFENQGSTNPSALAYVAAIDTLLCWRVRADGSERQIWL
jgi:hypothetical protein